jgi:hypothetical protein
LAIHKWIADNGMNIVVNDLAGLGRTGTLRDECLSIVLSLHSWGPPHFSRDAPRWHLLGHVLRHRENLGSVPGPPHCLYPDKAQTARSIGDEGLPGPTPTCRLAAS